jgi:hypothetical protein
MKKGDKPVNKWILVSFLALQAHFAASYLVPLDAASQREFGGLLRWLWPWADGDGGFLGRLTVGGEMPLLGLLLANGAAALFGLSALAACGLWVPSGWLRPMATAGAVLLLVLTALFFGPTRALPAVAALLTMYLALRRPGAIAVG